MGNQKDNKLPQCQLERLQDMMNSLYSEQQSDPHEERLGGSQQPMEKGETRENQSDFGWTHSAYQYRNPLNSTAVGRKGYAKMLS
jgi:hypothetical protein